MTGYLLALLVGYSFHEFLLRRIAGRTPFHPLHGALLAVSLALWTAAYVTPALFGGYLVIALAGWLGDRMLRHGSGRHALEGFAVRQLVMVGLLVAIWKVSAPVEVRTWYVELERWLFRDLGALAGWLRSNREAVAWALAGYLFIIDGGTRIVKGVLAKFPGLLSSVWLVGDGEREENVGEWIGVLERVLSMTLVLTDNFTALAFALTAKSLARFKELEQKEFSEYYLLGTLTSVTVAVAAGMAIRIAFRF